MEQGIDPVSMIAFRGHVTESVREADDVGGVGVDHRRPWRIIPVLAEFIATGAGRQAQQREDHEADPDPLRMAGINLK
jgi:hypothetical protein